MADAPLAAKSDWQIFTAALLQSTSTDVRDMFVSGVTKYASDASVANTEPLSDWYETSTGAIAGGFRARPVVGGHLALVSAFPSISSDIAHPLCSSPSRPRHGHFQPTTLNRYSLTSIPYESSSFASFSALNYYTNTTAHTN